MAGKSYGSAAALEVLVPIFLRRMLWELEQAAHVQVACSWGHIASLLCTYVHIHTITYIHMYVYIYRHKFKYMHIYIYVETHVQGPILANIPNQM